MHTKPQSATNPPIKPESSQRKISRIFSPLSQRIPDSSADYFFSVFCSLSFFSAAKQRTFMAAARAFRCELIRAPKPTASRRADSAEVPARVSVAKPVLPSVVAESENGGNKIMLQPRLCTLRSYGSDPISVIKTRKDGGDGVSPFFETLSEYIESSKKSQDFEIISGRLAMIVFAATVTTEVVTGNSLFRKMDLQGIEEAVGVCLGAVTFAAIFAWFSSARSRVGRMFTLTCNTFIDTIIDQIIDGLFYENELTDWSDDT